jgi:glycerate kinase
MSGTNNNTNYAIEVEVSHPERDDVDVADTVTITGENRIAYCDTAAAAAAAAVPKQHNYYGSSSVGLQPV